MSGQPFRLGEEGIPMASRPAEDDTYFQRTLVAAVLVLVISDILLFWTLFDFPPPLPKGW